MAGQMMGTPATISPEQLRGENADLRADLWSVGVILYEMLTGMRPFPGGMPVIFHNILTLDPTPPSEIAPGVPRAFDAVIARALAKAPADRYPAAATMAAAIRAALPAAAPAAVAKAPAPAPLPAPGVEDVTVRLPRPEAVQAAPPARGKSRLGAMLLGL